MTKKYYFAALFIVAILSISPFLLSTLAASPLVMSDVMAKPLSSQREVITWTTNRPSSSTVLYGTTAAYGMTATNPSDPVAFKSGSTTLYAHTVVLPTLTYLKYHFSAVSVEPKGTSSASSGDMTFTISVASTTPPIAPPRMR